MVADRRWKYFIIATIPRTFGACLVSCLASYPLFHPHLQLRLSRKNFLKYTFPTNCLPRRLLLIFSELERLPVNISLVVRRTNECHKRHPQPGNSTIIHHPPPTSNKVHPGDAEVDSGCLKFPVWTPWTLLGICLNGNGTEERRKESGWVALIPDPPFHMRS